MTRAALSVQRQIGQSDCDITAKNQLSLRVFNTLTRASYILNPLTPKSDLTCFIPYFSPLPLTQLK